MARVCIRPRLSPPRYAAGSSAAYASIHYVTPATHRPHPGQAWHGWKPKFTVQAPPAAHTHVGQAPAVGPHHTLPEVGNSRTSMHQPAEATTPVRL